MAPATLPFVTLRPAAALRGLEDGCWGFEEGEGLLCTPAALHHNDGNDGEHSRNPDQGDGERQCKGCTCHL